MLRTPLWLVAFVYVPVAVLLAFASQEMLIASPIGLIVFTMMEYAIHRWVFHHFEISNPALYDRLHGAHHRKPSDPKRRSVPLFYSAVVAIPVISLSLFGAIGSAIAAGITVGYILFEVAHAVAHSAWAKRLNIGLIRTLVRRHAAHHYKNAKAEFGILIPLWDNVFDSAP
jgi:4-hydroxysphinganine ceramide fatty acyl 2-hydroxylase